jgi:hypothetical protein
VFSIPLRDTILFRGKAEITIKKAIIISNLYIFHDFRGFYNVFIIYMAEMTMSRRFRDRRHISVHNVDFKDSYAYDRKPIFVFSRYIHIGEYIAYFNISKQGLLTVIFKNNIFIF